MSSEQRQIAKGPVSMRFLAVTLFLAILAATCSLCSGAAETDTPDSVAALRTQAEEQIAAREWKKAKATEGPATKTKAKGPG